MNTNTHLTVFGAVGLCEALNGSLLTLSGLTDRTQLTLHLGQLLLQLLHTETNRIKVTTCGFLKRIQTVNGALCGPYHVVGLALVDLGLQGLDLELGLLQLADTLTGRTLILVQLTLLLLDQILKHKHHYIIKQFSAYNMFILLSLVTIIHEDYILFVSKFMKNNGGCVTLGGLCNTRTFFKPCSFMCALCKRLQRGASH